MRRVTIIAAHFFQYLTLLHIVESRNNQISEQTKSKQLKKSSDCTAYPNRQRTINMIYIFAKPAETSLVKNLNYPDLFSRKQYVTE